MALTSAARRSCAHGSGRASRRQALVQPIASQRIQLGSGQLDAVNNVQAVRLRQSVIVAAGKGFGKAQPKPKVVPSEPQQPNVDPCPCQSGKNYKNCCQKVHEDASLATTPEATLRARFSAFVRNVPKYVIDTTHDDYYQYTYNKPATDPEVAAKYAADVEQGCNRFVYADFKVVRNEPGTIDDESFVAFSYKSAKAPPEGESVPADAWIMTDERCRLLRVGGRWLMADSQVYDRNLGELLQRVEAQQASKAQDAEAAAPAQ